MNKFKKILSALAVTIAFTTLASCGENSFYKEWHDAGATIEEENVFKELTVDEVVTKRDNKDSFIIFAGSSSKSGAISAVSDIQVQADSLDYNGYVYFVNTKDILSSISFRISDKSTDSTPNSCLAKSGGMFSFSSSKDIS